MITKVYTKYDIPFLEIHEPFFLPLLSEQDTDWVLGPTMGVRVYKVAYVEEGLEGVRFYHYD